MSSTRGVRITIVTYQHPGENGQELYRFCYVLLAIPSLPEESKAYSKIPDALEQAADF